MLFNIEDDPHEQFNVAQQNQSVCWEAVYYLNQWHDNIMKTMSYAVDPLWTVINEGGPFHAEGHLKQYCEWLKKRDVVMRYLSLSADILGSLLDRCFG